MKQKNIFFILLSIGLICICSQPSLANDLNLDVHIEGAKPLTGNALCDLYESRNHFLKKPTKTIVVPIDERGMTSCHFKNLKGGIYAVRVAYDENANEKLDKVFGVLREVFVLSVNEEASFAAPAFDKSMIFLDEDVQIDLAFEGVKIEIEFDDDLEEDDEDEEKEDDFGINGEP